MVRTIPERSPTLITPQGPSRQPFPNYPTAMLKLGEMKNGLIPPLLSDHRHARRLGPRVNLDPDRLTLTVIAILESDRERVHLMNDGAASTQKQPRPAFGAGHQRSLAFVEHEDHLAILDLKPLLAW
jgi:hypothetical protein